MEHPSRLSVLIGTGFGAGFWPWGPGTAGAFVATLIWVALSWVVAPTTLPWLTLFLVVAFTASGTWATKQLQPFWGNDPKRVVVDEMIGVWTPLIVVKPNDWLWIAAAFLLFRLFDIVKPLGIRSLDRRHGAFWVMADDLLAGIYSLLVILLLQWQT